MISLVCYNLKATNIYIFSLNPNQYFIKKNTVNNFQTLAQLKEQKDGHVSTCPSFRWYKENYSFWAVFFLPKIPSIFNTNNTCNK